jgi:phage gp16-like protein
MMDSEPIPIILPLIGGVAARHPGGQSRNRDLASIHIAKKQLGMEEDAYRAIIRAISNQRTDSSGELTDAERQQLLAHLKACGFKAKPQASAPQKNVAADKQAMMGRIATMLSANGRDWNYINAVAARMFKVARAEWCDKNQLHSLIGVLAKDARRHNRAI